MNSSTIREEMGFIPHPARAHGEQRNPVSAPGSTSAVRPNSASSATAYEQRHAKQDRAGRGGDSVQARGVGGDGLIMEARRVRRLAATSVRRIAIIILLVVRYWRHGPGDLRGAPGSINLFLDDIHGKSEKTPRCNAIHNAAGLMYSCSSLVVLLSSPHPRVYYASCAPACLQKLRRVRGPAAG